MPHFQNTSRSGHTRQKFFCHAWVLLFVILFIQGRAIAAPRFFTIQVSSNKKEQSALNEVDRFKKQGYDAFYHHEETGDKESWYRVYVGRYGTREEALEAAGKLEEQGLISSYAIRAMSGMVTEETPRQERSEKKSTSPAKRFDFSAPAKQAPDADKESDRQTPAGGGFQGAPAKPGAGGPAIQFKVPGKTGVPAETLPPEEKKEDSKGPLRRKGGVVSKADVRQMLLKHRFYSTCSSHNFDFCNADGEFANQFEDNGDGTVTDRATHLMWQKGGSEEGRTYLDALQYAQELNKKAFGGHSDWRVPTIEELASLLESSWKNEDLFIEPIFDPKQKSCWSTDTLGLERAWNVDFHLGYVTDDPMTFLHWVRAVRSVP